MPSNKPHAVKSKRVETEQMHFLDFQQYFYNERHNKTLSDLCGATKLCTNKNEK